MLILDTQNMESIASLTAGHTDREGTGFAIAPDGAVFACISDSSVRLWKTEDWSEMPSLKHERDLRAIAFASTGLLAAADPQGRVTFWDVQQNSKQGNPLETERSLSCLAFSPNGNRLATSHANGNGQSASLIVWDVATRKQQSQLLKRSQPVTALAWSNGGDRSLIAAGFADGNIRMWEGMNFGDSGWMVAGAAVKTLAFSPDGKKLVAGTARNNTVVVWETDSTQRITQIKGHYRAISGVGFVGDDQTILSCSVDGNLKTWNIEQSEPFTRLRKEVTDSEVLIPGSVVIPDQKPEDQTVLSGNNKFVAVYKPCGESENRLQVWKTVAAEPELLIDHVLSGDPLAESPSNMVISDNGSVIAWSRGGKLVLFNRSTGKQTSGSINAGASTLALSHDGRFLAEHNNWDARIWNVSNGSPSTRKI